MNHTRPATLTATDKYLTEIKVGDVLYASNKGEVVRVTVVGFGDDYHNGYGHWTRQVKVVVHGTNRKITINNPGTTIRDER